MSLLKAVTERRVKETPKLEKWKLDRIYGKAAQDTVINLNQDLETRGIEQKLKLEIEKQNRVNL